MSDTILSVVLTVLGGTVGVLGVVAAGSIGVAALGLLAVFAAWLIHSQDAQVATR